MPKELNYTEMDRIATDLGYASFDDAIIDLYFGLKWALTPISNRFVVSAVTVKNRIVKVHGRKLRPKGGRRKSDAPIEKPIPVKSLNKRYDCENYKTQRGYSGGNSIWHAEEGAGV